jgi:hypothetical protein
MRNAHSTAHFERPAPHLRVVRGSGDTAAAWDDLTGANPMGAWLQLIDLTMAKLEEAIAAFEKEREDFEKWASDERAAIARERAARRRWFR